MKRTRTFMVLLTALPIAACIPPEARQGVEAPTPPPNMGADAASAELAEPQPVWSAQQVAPNAQVVTASTYIVQPGDTLRGIGNRTGAGSEVIATANGIAPPFLIHPGQKLKIPGGRYHLVAEGETGIAIAAAYGVPWARVVDANGLTEPFVLRRGQRLLLPSPPGAQSMEERAAAFRISIDDVLTG
ncbi:MAG: LysM peptidoglycan-binding domain-containing protein, partial [Sphingobium sp.]